MAVFSDSPSVRRSETQSSHIAQTVPRNVTTSAGRTDDPPTSRRGMVERAANMAASPPGPGGRRSTDGAHRARTIHGRYRPYP